MPQPAKKTTAPRRPAAPETEPDSNTLDPLADLREPDHPADQATILPGGGLIEGVQPGPPAEGEEPAVEVRPLVSQGIQDQMVSEVVAAWHADPSSLGFLHGGGSMCGCRYMARVALQAAVPVVTEEDLEERDLEPSHG